MKNKDPEILQAIKKGDDHKALEALYKSLFPKIKKLVNCGEEKEEECKDILQEALLIFYKQVLNNKFKEEYSVEGFVYTIANNLWINRIKKKKRIVYLENERIPEIADSNVLDELEMEERRQMVNNLFNKLDVKCKTLLTYTIFDNLSMTEVAKKMGFNSPNAATVASFRCKKFLIELARKNKTAQML